MALRSVNEEYGGSDGENGLGGRNGHNQNGGIELITVAEISHFFLARTRGRAVWWGWMS